MPNRRFDWHERIKSIEGEYYWAHENEDELESMLTMSESRARLQKFLSWLPEEWD